MKKTLTALAVAALAAQAHTKQQASKQARSVKWQQYLNKPHSHLSDRNGCS